MEKLKKFFGAVWDWVKKNWLTILIVIGVCLLTASAFSQFDQTKSYKNLLEQYHQESRDHQQQIKELRLIVEEERIEQARLLQEYLVEQNRLETEFKEVLGQIDDTRDNTQTQIVRRHDRDPTTLTGAVTNTFGIPSE